MGDDLETPILPREKLRALGPDALSDRELLAVVLGTACSRRSVFEVAAELLPDHHALASLSRVGLSQLVRVEGLGWAGACRIAATLEIARRIRRVGLRPGRRITRAREVHDLLGGEAAVSRVESAWVLGLDARHGVLGSRCISVGSVNSSIVHPREVFHSALAMSAAALILAHNHPSGDPSPSREDHEVTQRVAAAGDVLGVELLDHVVLGAGSYFSFREGGWLPLRGASGCSAATG